MNEKQKKSLQNSIESGVYIKHSYRKDKVLDIYFNNEFMIQVDSDSNIYYVFNRSAYNAIEITCIRSLINIIY